MLLIASRFESCCRWRNEFPDRETPLGCSQNMYIGFWFPRAGASYINSCHSLTWVHRVNVRIKRLCNRKSDLKDGSDPTQIIYALGKRFNLNGFKVEVKGWIEIIYPYTLFLDRLIPVPTSQNRIHEYMACRAFETFEPKCPGEPFLVQGLRRSGKWKGGGEF